MKTEFNAKFRGLTADLTTKNQIISLEIDTDFRPFVDSFGDGWISTTMKPAKNARSLSANALLWAICGDIAAGTTPPMKKDDVYIQLLRDYGVSDYVSIRAGIDPAKYFKYYDKAGEGEIGGKKFIHYRVYAGSSEYDSAEMSRLIDGALEDARQMGLPPRFTEAEIAAAKERGSWD